MKTSFKQVKDNTDIKHFFERLSLFLGYKLLWDSNERMKLLLRNMITGTHVKSMYTMSGDFLQPMYSRTTLLALPGLSKGIQKQKHFKDIKSSNRKTILASSLS
jgi:hypothetical protein